MSVCVWCGGQFVNQVDGKCVFVCVCVCACVCVYVCVCVCGVGDSLSMKAQRECRWDGWNTAWSRQLAPYRVTATESRSSGSAAVDLGASGHVAGKSIQESH